MVVGEQDEFLLPIREHDPAKGIGAVSLGMESREERMG